MKLPAAFSRFLIVLKLHLSNISFLLRLNDIFDVTLPKQEATRFSKPRSQVLKKFIFSTATLHYLDYLAVALVRA